MSYPIGSIDGIEIHAHRDFADGTNTYWLGETAGAWAMPTAVR